MAETQSLLTTSRDDASRTPGDRVEREDTLPQPATPLKPSRVQFSAHNNICEYDGNQPATTAPTGQPEGGTAHNNQEELSPHGKRAKTQTICVEYISVHTTGKAYNKWAQVMSLLREMDQSLTIHPLQDSYKPILPQHSLPATSSGEHYATMTKIQHRNRPKTKFASVTTITTNRTIGELKRDNPQFITKLMKLQVYVRHTNLLTADSVEVKYFVGMHPPLTNLAWRTE